MNAPLLPSQTQQPSLEAQAESVQTHEDFARFARRLSDELAAGETEWDNDTLPTYFEGLAGFSEDIEGYFQHRKEAVPDQPSWNLVAKILLAARVYE